MRTIFSILFYCFSITLLASSAGSNSTSSSGGGGGGTWGSITGTLSSQSDLNTQLGLKTTGSGTLNLMSKWSSSSVLADSKWKDATNGELQFQNSAAAKGSKTVPLVDLIPGTGTGLFSNSSNELNMCSAGGHVLNLDSAGTNILDPNAPTTNYVRVLNSSGNLGFTMNGAGTQYTFTPVSGAANARINIQGASGESNMTLIAYPSSNATTPYLGVLQNQNDAFVVTNVVGSANGSASVGIGTPLTKNNALTVTGYADITNVRGTTTVSSSTTVTGVGTLFTNDFGIGDFISVSSAASTYARITAIASATSMTVDTAIGNGASQTMNKKQALQSWRLAAGTVVADIDPNGKRGCRSGVTCGTAACNGATEVTVTTASVGASTIIHYSFQATGGSPLGVVYTSARSAGTSFGFKCAATDTSTVGWELVEPR